MHTLNEPKRWNREAGNTEVVGIGRRPRVFCASLADWLDDEVPIDWLEDLLEMIRITPHLDWLMLTKRPENWKSRLDAVLERQILPEDDEAMAPLNDWLMGWYNGEPSANVWMGISVEDQTRADERVPTLLKIPAAVRFLSCEPLLGPVNLKGGSYSPDWLEGWDVEQTQPDGEPQQVQTSKIDWVIVGGESGPGARVMDPQWAIDLRKQCQGAAGFFMKQMGGVADHHGELEEFPEELRVRENPVR